MNPFPKKTEIPDEFTDLKRKINELLDDINSEITICFEQIKKCNALLASSLSNFLSNIFIKVIRIMIFGITTDEVKIKIQNIIKRLKEIIDKVDGFNKGAGGKFQICPENFFGISNGLNPAVSGAKILYKILKIGSINIKSIDELIVKVDEKLNGNLEKNLPQLKDLSSQTMEIIHDFINLAKYFEQVEEINGSYNKLIIDPGLSPIRMYLNSNDDCVTCQNKLSDRFDKLLSLIEKVKKYCDENVFKFPGSSEQLVILTRNFWELFKTKYMHRIPIDIYLSYVVNGNPADDNLNQKIGLLIFWIEKNDLDKVRQISAEIPDLEKLFRCSFRVFDEENPYTIISYALDHAENEIVKFLLEKFFTCVMAIKCNKLSIYLPPHLTFEQLEKYLSQVGKEYHYLVCIFLNHLSILMDISSQEIIELKQCKVINQDLFRKMCRISCLLYNYIDYIYLAISRDFSKADKPNQIDQFKKEMPKYRTILEIGYAALGNLLTIFQRWQNSHFPLQTQKNIDWLKHFIFYLVLRCALAVDVSIRRLGGLFDNGVRKEIEEKLRNLLIYKTADSLKNDTILSMLKYQDKLQIKPRWFVFLLAMLDKSKRISYDISILNDLLKCESGMALQTILVRYENSINFDALLDEVGLSLGNPQELMDKIKHANDFLDKDSHGMLQLKVIFLEVLINLKDYLEDIYDKDVAAKLKKEIECFVKVASAKLTSIQDRDLGVNINSKEKFMPKKKQNERDKKKSNAKKSLEPKSDQVSKQRSKQTLLFKKVDSKQSSPNAWLEGQLPKMDKLIENGWNLRIAAKEIENGRYVEGLKVFLTIITNFENGKFPAEQNNQFSRLYESALNGQLQCFEKLGLKIELVDAIEKLLKCVWNKYVAKSYTDAVDGFRRIIEYVKKNGLLTNPGIDFMQVYTSALKGLLCSSEKLGQTNVIVEMYDALYQLALDKLKGNQFIEALNDFEVIVKLFERGEGGKVNDLHKIYISSLNGEVECYKHLNKMENIFEIIKKLSKIAREEFIDKEFSIAFDSYEMIAEWLSLVEDFMIEYCALNDDVENIKRTREEALQYQVQCCIEFPQKEAKIKKLCEEFSSPGNQLLLAKFYEENKKFEAAKIEYQAILDRGVIRDGVIKEAELGLSRCGGNASFRNPINPVRTVVSSSSASSEMPVEEHVAISQKIAQLHSGVFFQSIPLENIRANDILKSILLFLNVHPNICLLMFNFGLVLTGGAILELLFHKRIMSDMDFITAFALEDIQQSYGGKIIHSKAGNIIHTVVDNIPIDILYDPNVISRQGLQNNLRGRDFTINALASYIDNRNNLVLLDLVDCGVEKFGLNAIRCIKSPKITFTEDPTRLFRLVKLMNKCSSLSVDYSIFGFLKSGYTEFVGQSSVMPKKLFQVLQNFLFCENGYANYKQALEQNIFTAFFSLLAPCCWTTTRISLTEFLAKLNAKNLRATNPYGLLNRLNLAILDGIQRFKSGDSSEIDIETILIKVFGPEQKIAISAFITRPVDFYSPHQVNYGR